MHAFPNFLVPHVGIFPNFPPRMSIDETPTLSMWIMGLMRLKIQAYWGMKSHVWKLENCV
ncbi:hypothetical protein Cni_G16500 [Canna indica]|uniref:Uncharacterized protein n=1 Tax=Canna indica TaxID=4628 RepID=A0AAQ3QFX6_9LILI|nr:hypothetical protein Cni_G16500 [Canna indica]